ncbi:MAG: type IX secretion system outer membrane channel protein PorV [Bacteroidales bacterium]
MRRYSIISAYFTLSSALFFLSFSLPAQTINNSLGQELNVITTAVPFLMIAPDARAGAMGDAGVSSTPDANSIHWNPAKLAFINKDMGFSVSYSPWLRKLVPDISLAYVSGFKRLDDKQAFGMSLLYFSLGNIDFTDQNGLITGTFNPSEFALDASYSRKFTKTISGAVSGRFIYSNLTQGQVVQGAQTKAGTSGAADVAVYSHHPISFNNMTGIFAWGINISNIGAKISYGKGKDPNSTDFIPTNLRFGPSITLDLDDYNRMTFMLDFNKLLVPTPPIYELDSNNQPVFNSDGSQKIKDGEGLSPKVSVPKGMLQSFYDAPGGFTEEMREFSLAAGLEYWYDKQFALRGGFFYEDKNKGNRKFFSLGAGLKYNVFGLDFSYLIPMEQQNPLENTLRFSLIFDFDSFGNQGSTK